MMEYPDCVAPTLLLAGAADPLLAGPRWYNWLTEFPPVSWVVALSGTGLKQSNDEMMQVRAGLEEVQDTWTLIRHPVTLIKVKMTGWSIRTTPISLKRSSLIFPPDNPRRKGASDCPP